MTILDAIKGFDALTPNPLPFPTKVQWLSNLDGQIWRDVPSCREEAGDFSGYTEATDPQTRLLVPHPYEELYRWYLEMMVWDALGEMSRYNNAAQKYNTVLLRYMDDVNRSRIPLRGTQLRLI